jgi:hypothetical protein
LARRCRVSDWGPFVFELGPHRTSFASNLSILTAVSPRSLWKYRIYSYRRDSRLCSCDVGQQDYHCQRHPRRCHAMGSPEDASWWHLWRVYRVRYCKSLSHSPR